MGKKKETVEVKKEETPEVEAEEEDTPIIKSLKAIDDKYCAVEVELEQEIEKLRKKFDERQAPLLEERKKVLSDTADAPAEAKEFGTPACPDFWIQAMNNAAEFEELLHENDEQVLKYLDDIQRSYLDPAVPQKGSKLEFFFKENPFFTNSSLWLEAHHDFSLDTYKPYKEVDCCEVKCCTIDWKPGKNITVQKVKSDKGKKGSKSKVKAKEEPCPSFFRILFTACKIDEPFPEALECIYQDDEDDEDDDMSECHLANVSEVVQFIGQQFLPYAVRYYTGEAADEEEDDDEGEESEEEDDEDDSEEESEEPAAKPKGKKKVAVPKAGAAGEKTEECKQQ